MVSNNIFGFFHRIGPLGGFGLVVAMSVRVMYPAVYLVPFPCVFFHQEIAGYGPLQSSDQ